MSARPRFLEKPLSPAKLCGILRQYGVKTHNVRVGTQVSSGYASTDFREALQRYIPREMVDRRLEEINARGELDREQDKLLQQLARLDKAGRVSSAEVNPLEVKSSQHDM